MEINSKNIKKVLNKYLSTDQTHVYECMSTELKKCYIHTLQNKNLKDFKEIKRFTPIDFCKCKYIFKLLSPKGKELCLLLYLDFATKDLELYEKDALNVYPKSLKIQYSKYLIVNSVYKPKQPRDYLRFCFMRKKIAMNESERKNIVEFLRTYEDIKDRVRHLCNHEFIRIAKSKGLNKNLVVKSLEKFITLMHLQVGKDSICTYFSNQHTSY